MKINKWVLPIACCLTLSAACGGSDDTHEDPIATTTVRISDPTVSEVAADKASLSATISTNNTSAILKKGFCYAMQPNASISDQTVEMNNAGTSLSCTLSGLQAETTYYTKAFATIANSEPVYSKEISFTTAVPSATSELDTYIPPTYADDYTGIATWNSRAQWNLANVHDPSVVLAEDGYYYMYQTDASYGNAHTAGGHFHSGFRRA